jgi:hypothetical protein
MAVRKKEAQRRSEQEKSINNRNKIKVYGPQQHVYVNLIKIFSTSHMQHTSTYASVKLPSFVVRNFALSPGGIFTFIVENHKNNFFFRMKISRTVWNIMKKFQAFYGNNSIIEN